MNQITQYLKRASEATPSGLATIDLRRKRRRTRQEFKDRVARLAGALQSLGMNYLGAEPTRYLSDFNLLFFPTQRVGELNHL
jgi:acyl-CoA synthetase (AMP-forming)/AMP-acid ligase II